MSRAEDCARVIVIGGGIAGVSIAFELAADATVVLLEQESELAFHTTGRSAAMYLQSYGNPTVRALTVASRPDFDRLAADLGTVPLLRDQPQVWLAASGEEHRLTALLATGAPLTALSPEEAAGLCEVLRPERLAGAAIDNSAMEIDVAALHQAYARGLIQRGGRICRATAVTAISRGRGPGWEVVAGGETFEADTVVNAAGAWVDRVAALAGVAPIGIQPLRRTLFTSPVRRHSSGRGWPFVADLGERFYFHADGDQVLVSPAEETPSEPCDARADPVEVARAIGAINDFTTLELRSVRKAWAGLRSFTADRAPVLGSRPGDGRFHWSAGQGGYGIQMAPALARAGAALVVGRRLPADIAALGLTAAALSPDRPGIG